MMRSTGWLARGSSLILAFTVFPNTRILAQTPTAASQSAETKQNPQGISPQNDWHVDFGYQYDLHLVGQNSLYYQFLYQGKRLYGQGQAITPTNVNGTSSAQDPPSDTNDLTFSLERNSAALSGGILNSLFTKPLALNEPFLRELRGVLQVTAPTDFKQFNVAGGVESRNLRELNPFHWLNQATNGQAKIVNWLFVGAQAQSKTATASAGSNQDDGLLTYRAFVGRGFKPVAIASQTAADKKKDADELEIIRNNTETRTPAQKTALQGGILDKNMFTAYTDKIRAKNASSMTQEELLLFVFVDRMLETPDEIKNELKPGASPHAFHFKPEDIQKFLQLFPHPNDFDNQIQAELASYYKVKKIQPTWAIWVESSAWYSLFAPSTGPRFNNLFAANLRYYLNPTKDNPTFLQLRFESGKQRAAPTVDLKSLTLSMGISF